MRAATHARGASAILAATVVAATAGCTVDDLLPPSPPPAISSAAITPGPENVLSAVVSVSVRYADSVRVRFGPAGEPLDSVSPVTVVLPSDTVHLPVLGLLPATAYRLQVVAYGAAGSIAGDTLLFTTGALPADLPSYSAGGSAPTPGYVVFGAYPYGVVIDNSGRVVWYRHLEHGATLNFQVQPTGRYTTMPITAPTGDVTPWVEFDELGNETRRMVCANGLVARFHDLREEPDGSYWLLATTRASWT